MPEEGQGRRGQDMSTDVDEIHANIHQTTSSRGVNQWDVVLASRLMEAKAPVRQMKWSIRGGKA